MRIQIDMQWARIETDVRLPKVQVRKAESSYALTTNLPQIRTEQERPQIKIDDAGVRADLGLGDLSAVAKSCRKRWEEAARRSIAEVVRKGDELAKPRTASERERSIIGEQAKQGCIDHVDTNVGVLPSSMLTIECRASQLEILAELGDVRLQYTPIHITGRAELGQVTTYLRQPAKAIISLLA